MPRTRLIDVGESKGIGLLTLDPLESGDLIGEYLGEVVNEEKLHLRQQQVYMGEKHRYLMALGRKEFIDATRKGGLVRFMNHSCDPNCHVEKWQIDGEERIALFASRTIKAMEELTYDYKFETFHDVSNMSDYSI
jgi:histone-lysine N-methyltransferase SETD2